MTRRLLAAPAIAPLNSTARYYSLSSVRDICIHAYYLFNYEWGDRYLDKLRGKMEKSMRISMWNSRYNFVADPELGEKVAACQIPCGCAQCVQKGGKSMTGGAHSERK